MTRWTVVEPEARVAPTEDVEPLCCTVVRRTALVAALALTTVEVKGDTGMDGTVRLRSPLGVVDTLARLRAALEGRGFRIFAEIDHRAAAAEVGLEMPPTTVLLYGNPRGGTPLMLAAPDFALELPLRVLVRQDADGMTRVTLNPASALEGRHGLPGGMAARLAPAEQVIAGAIAGRGP